MRGKFMRWIGVVCSALALAAAPSAFAEPTALAARVHDQVQMCQGAANAITDTKISDLLLKFNDLTTTNGSCRWQGLAGDPAETVALAEAARAEIVALSAGCNPAELFCDAATRLIARVDAVLNAVRNNTELPPADDLTFFDDLKAFGLSDQAIDPLRISLAPSVTLTSQQWTDRLRGDLGTLVNMLGNQMDQPCEPCLERMKRALPLAPIFDVMSLSLGVSQAGIWRGIHADAKRNRERWDAYHFGGGSARTPLPWELWVNGLVYQALVKQEDRKGLVSETPAGPPNLALTVAHPSVGVVPYDSKGAESNIVGVVEGIGFSMWSYDDETNARKGEWGASLVGVYQPREDLDDWSMGALIRLPVEGVSILYSRPELANGRHDEVWAFSVDISKFGLTSLGSDIWCTFGLPSCKKQ